MGLIRNKYVYWGACALLVLTVLVTHFIMLADVPRGLSVDEANLAYDAWAIAETGRDSFLNPLPVYLTNRGDGMSALYAYLAVPLVMLFDISVAGLRFPAALFSLLTLGAGVYLIKAQWPKRRLPLLLYLFLFAVAPYFTMYSRIALDCNLFLPLATVLLALIAHSLKSEKSRWWLVGTVAGITLYSYALSWLIVPLFLGVFTVYMLWARRLAWLRMLELWAPFILLALPLVGFLVINIFEWESFIVGPFSLPRMISVRSDGFAFAPSHLIGLFMSLLVKDKVFLYASAWVTPFYHPSILLYAVGVARAIPRAISTAKQKNMNVILLVSLWAATYTLCAFFFGGYGLGPIMHQLNGLFWATLFFIVLGLVTIFDWLKKRAADQSHVRHLPIIAMGVFVMSYTVLVGLFCYDYFYLYPKSWDEGVTSAHVSSIFGSITSDLDSLTEAIEYVESTPLDVRNRATYIRHVQMPDVMFLLSQRIPPDEVIDQRLIDGRVWDYRQYNFRKPERHTLDENYIVAHWDGEELTMLHNMGFSDVRRFGKHWVFTNP
jgi:uncharacterized protein with PQ loop repeat